MPVSIDEIIAKRKTSTSEDGTMYRAVILSDPEEKGYDAESRSQRFVMSTEAEDLYGDIVRQKGLVLDNFLKNPVALAFHNHRAPIGWWGDVKVVNGKQKRTEGILTLHAEGTTDVVDEVSRLLEANAIKACSIGFMPLEAEWIEDADGNRTWGLDFTKASLLECSVCSIPANPEALAKAANGDMKLASEMFERILDTYCEEKSGGLFVRKEFADEYFKLREERTVHANAKNSIMIDVDVNTDDAKEQVDGLLDHLRKGLASIFGAKPEDIPQFIESRDATKIKDPWAEHEMNPIVINQIEDGSLTIDKFPAKTAIDAALMDTVEDSLFSKSEGIVTVRASNKVAEYEVVGGGGGFHVKNLIYLNFIKEYEPEPEAPVLVEGSRAKAEARTAKLKAKLAKQGLSS